MTEKKVYTLLIFILCGISAFPQNNNEYRSKDILKMRWGRVATQMPHDWYGTDKAIQIAENVLISQKEIGGWIKNYPYHRPFSDSLKNHFLNSKAEIGGTFDNGATTTEMKFLAKVYSYSKDARYKEAFIRGLNYILLAQYENGGWPQFYPRRDINDEIATDKTVPYSMHITYNDDAMINVMLLLKGVYTDSNEFADLNISKELKEKSKNAFEKGVECILETQIVVDGKPTVWCAQHDFRTLRPVKARSYELESFSGGESVGIVLLLMDIDHPSKQIVDAIEGAVKWFDEHKIEGIKVQSQLNSNGEYDRVVVNDSDTPPIWARFYDLDTEKPIFCSRDGIKRETIAEISFERRNGYSWYTYAPQILNKKYKEWKEKWVDVNFLPLKDNSSKHRVLISTDIGGTDPDDNQSMAHLLMYSNEFNLEGLISSPSYGNGSVSEILRMIDLYEKDLPKLEKHRSDFPTPDYLRSITKQGRRGEAPYSGYSYSTEGSDWIINCARRENEEPLWILVWGGLEDIAQALHDAPDIKNKIRVYWIGGPNKKWSVNSYMYIAENFPDLWLIEANSSYRGFISDYNKKDEFNELYYNTHIRDRGSLGKDFVIYLDGNIKMGDTPSLLYMMDGNPDDPFEESWGGSFVALHYSPRVIFNGLTTERDTAQIYSIIEFKFRGPRVDIPQDSVCVYMTINKQTWGGYYLGNGEYVVRHSTYSLGTHPYIIESNIPGFVSQKGAITINNQWPGKMRSTDYKLGNYWFTDRSDPDLFEKELHGYKTVSKWRVKVMTDWAQRWNWLK